MRSTKVLPPTGTTDPAPDENGSNNNNGGGSNNNHGDSGQNGNNSSGGTNNSNSNNTSYYTETTLDTVSTTTSTTAPGILGFGGIHQETEANGDTLVFGSHFFEGDSHTNTMSYEHFGYATQPAAIGGGTERTYPAIDPTLTQGIDTGTWVEESGFWYYRFSSGELAKKGFALVKENTGCNYYWYYFDADGALGINWIDVDAAKLQWAYSSSEPGEHYGAIEIGWIYSEEDGRTYYMSEVNAIMLSGWVGFAENTNTTPHWYDFKKASDVGRDNWYWDPASRRWIYDQMGYEPYGALYVNEMTPDGLMTDPSGLTQR